MGNVDNTDPHQNAALCGTFFIFELLEIFFMKGFLYENSIQSSAVCRSVLYDTAYNNILLGMAESFMGIDLFSAADWGNLFYA
ncbi:MAG: hypothetical protein K2K57_06430 [Oscillospiraceae bacterium]|nr:hypothetical protein [Oscillospiraceae bacterium]